MSLCGVLAVVADGMEQVMVKCKRDVRCKIKEETWSVVSKSGLREVSLNTFMWTFSVISPSQIRVTRGNEASGIHVQVDILLLPGLSLDY